MSITAARAALETMCSPMMGAENSIAEASGPLTENMVVSPEIPVIA
jgi:hypothetical protein